MTSVSELGCPRGVSFLQVAPPANWWCLLEIGRTICMSLLFHAFRLLVQQVEGGFFSFRVDFACGGNV